MHLRRIACLLLGAWLAGTMVVGWIAMGNFAAADRVLASPPAELEKIITGLGPNQAHMFLRYLVAVENTNYFLTWELVEFALLALIAALLFLDRRIRMQAMLPCLLFLLVAFQHFRLTREIVWLGQSIVLAGGGASASLRQEFGAVHRIYGLIEVVKLLLGLLLAILLVSGIWRRIARSSRLKQLDSIAAPNQRYAG